MRGPNQWIHILVFTLYPASLQCLKAKQTPFIQLVYPQHASTVVYCIHNIVIQVLCLWPWCMFLLTSLSKLSTCSSSMPRSKLTWWNFLVMLRWRSRSRRVSEFSMRPSTKWLWKAWEYWGNPTSLNQALATQWWSISAALDNLCDKVTNSFFRTNLKISWQTHCE